MKTRATRVDDGYVLNGTKQFCTNGGIADYHVIYANTDPSKGPAGIASFLVPKGTPGMRMGRKEQKLGVRASHTAQVIFEDCQIPIDHRLGAVAMKKDSSLFGNLPDLFHRMNHADLVVGRHQGNEYCFLCNRGG